MSASIARRSFGVGWLIVVGVGVHLLCRHFGVYLDSAGIYRVRDIERIGLYLLYPGFLPAMFVWPGPHHPGWWSWLEIYNIGFYVAVVGFVWRRLRTKPAGGKS